MSKRIVGLHRPKGVEREKNDFYATHPSAIPPLLNVLGWQNGGKLIRENSCGMGHLSRPMIDAGHTVISTDLINRGYGIPDIDFLTDSWLDGLGYDAIIMNPPYKLAMQFVKKSLRLAPVVCAFLRLSWLESEGRAEFFRKHPPAIVAVFKKRVPSAKNANFEKAGSSTVAYAWFIWYRGYTGEPVIKWI